VGAGAASASIHDEAGELGLKLDETHLRIASGWKTEPDCIQAVLSNLPLD
jgi:hypothetical protein